MHRISFPVTSKVQYACKFLFVAPMLKHNAPLYHLRQCSTIKSASLPSWFRVQWQNCMYAQAINDFFICAFLVFCSFTFFIKETKLHWRRMIFSMNQFCIVTDVFGDYPFTFCIKEIVHYAKLIMSKKRIVRYSVRKNDRIYASVL